MFVKITLFFIILTVLSYAQNEEFDEYLEELKDEFEIKQVLADSLSNLNGVILDTREIEEYEVSHIKNAIHVGYNDFDLDQLESINKDTLVIVYCSVGYRSCVIGEQLSDAGFKNVRNLYGGIFKWVNENRTIVKDSTQTDTIHTYDENWGQYITNENVIKVP